MAAPKVTVTSARTCGAGGLAGVRVDAAGQVDGDDRAAVRRGAQPATSPAAGSRRPGRAAEPDDAVDDEVGAGPSSRAASARPGRRGVERPAAGRAQRREPLGVHGAAQQHGVDPTPRRASRAPAHSASPPLLPAPTSSDDAGAR